MLKSRLHIEIGRAFLLGKALLNPRAKRYVGYINRKNFGDDLLYDIYRRISSDNVLPILDVYKGQGKIPGRVVLGGGTILGGPIYAQALEKLSPPEFVFCAGVIPNSLNDFWAEKLKDTFVMTRSTQSSEALAQIGISSQPFVDPGLFTSKVYKSKYTPSERKPYVIAPHGVHQNIPWYKNCITALKGEVIYFASHPSDMVPIEKLARPHDQIVRGWKNVASSVELLSKAKLVISTRLHPAVCAASYKVPFLLIEYEDKHKEFAESIGLISRVIPTSEISSAFNTEMLEADINWEVVDGWLKRFPELINAVKFSQFKSE